MDLPQLFINGILLGSVYAIIGLGMTIIFGIVGLSNLAHGEFVVLGAYASTLLALRFGVDPILTLIITVPLMFLAGYLLQRVLVSPAMKMGGEPALLVMFALSIILKDAMLLVFSADAKHASVPYGNSTLHLGAVDVPLLNIVLFAIGLVTVLILTLFLKKTYIGRAIRAVSDDKNVASLSGINVKQIYAVAMGIAMACSAIAGLCVGMKWTFYPSSGGEYLLTAFIVAVIGGMDSIPGTLLAGLGFGLAQVIGGANYGLLISYIVMLIVLAVRRGDSTWQ